MGISLLLLLTLARLFMQLYRNTNYEIAYITISLIAKTQLLGRIASKKNKFYSQNAFIIN